MKKICKNCTHWNRIEGHYVDVLDDIRDPGISEELDEHWMPIRDDEKFKKVTGVLVKVCCNPKISFYEVPKLGCASVVDGSGYKGCLITEENFGCTLFEKLSVR